MSPCFLINFSLHSHLLYFFSLFYMQLKLNGQTKNMLSRSDLRALLGGDSGTCGSAHLSCLSAKCKCLNGDVHDAESKCSDFPGVCDTSGDVNYDLYCYKICNSQSEGYTLGSSSFTGADCHSSCS